MLYKDFFDVKEDYAPCMTKEAINRNPETWLQFYPHKTFVDLLRTLVDKMNGGSQSVWLTGPYGTGKSHAALVLQKLFMDDDTRLDEWLTEKKTLIPSEISKALKQLRKSNVLAVYDSGSDTVTTPHHLLVRIEKAIQDALVSSGYKIPVMGSLEKMIARVHKEGAHFFKTRDDLQSKLCYLTNDIKNADVWEKLVRKSELSNELISDTMRVLEADSIFLDLSAENLIKWVNAILQANGISKILFIWDEFSTYIEKHANELKTFEAIAEASQEGRFFFMPVTHMDITAYMAAGSASAKKANDRFVFKALDMPTNTALLLGADAFKVKNGAEWEKERAILWHSVRGVIDNYMVPRAGGEVVAEDFKGILPIHPMAAFVLKYLATAVGSNQRSMFNYLKGNSGDSEFQQFISVGGPDVQGFQFLTVDYLWRYFIERDDLGRDKDVLLTQAEYSRKSSTLSDIERRILKGVLLYSLLGRRTHGGGHELVQPTIENVVRSFEGDGIIVGVEGILKDLANKHCFSIVNGRCEMFRSSADGEELLKEIGKVSSLFNMLILTDKTLPKLESRVKAYKDKHRYVIQVSTAEKCTPSAVRSKELYGPMGNKVLVYFILARDAHEQLLVPEKAKTMSAHFKDFRIVFVTMSEATFCDGNANRWQEYAEQVARKTLASADPGAQKLHQNQLAVMEEEWISRICNPQQKLRVYKPNPNGDSYQSDLVWAQMEARLQIFIKETFESFLDEYSGYNLAAMGTPSALQNWAKAGMQGCNFQLAGAWRPVVQAFLNNGISFDDSWFDANPTHPLTQLRNVCKAKLDNTVGKGETGSLRKFYIELQRPPFGLIGVPYTAFVLGFVLREWLTSMRQIQWTDGAISKRIDAESLAEIIEAVVKDDGNNSIKNEKLLCRLSKEEKSFIEKSGVIFGMQVNPNSTVENTLQEIAARLEKVSGRAPLWVLGDYIRSDNDPQAEVLCEMIELLCKANAISSKGNIEDRSNYIKRIGDCLLKTDGLADVLARYIKPDIFADAFKRYVDDVKPALSGRAVAVGDIANQYCQILKNQCAVTAGWLWTKQNVDSELENVYMQYGIVQQIQRLTGQSGYLLFEDAITRVKLAMNKDNKISLAMIGGNYPALVRLIQIVNAVKIVDTLAELEQVLIQQHDLIRTLFFDPALTEQIKLLKKVFADTLQDLGDSDLRELYASLTDGAGRSENDFKAQALVEIEAFFKNSMSRQITELWKKHTGFESPKAFSKKSGMPASMWLNDVFVGHLEVISSPMSYVPERLKETREVLEGDAFAVAQGDEQAVHSRFLERALPMRYRKLGIDAMALSMELKKELGADPDSWLTSPQFSEKVEKIIRARYQSIYREKALAKVNLMSPETAKQRLINFVESIPEVGLDILE